MHDEQQRTRRMPENMPNPGSTQSRIMRAILSLRKLAMYPSIGALLYQNPYELLNKQFQN